MMQKNQHITLVMVCDNHLVVMLAALLKSIENTHQSEFILDIYIVSDGIHQSNIDKVDSVITSNKINLHWKTMKEVIPKNIVLPRDRSSFPLCAYARLCAPDFLPQHIERAIYLDVDMLVMSDISHLWMIDTGDYAVAAVLDRSKFVSSSWAGIPNYEELNIPSDTKYFNSGLLIMDLKKWREMNAIKSILDVIHYNARHVIFPDQYGLNVVFANNWFELDPRWNSYAQDDDIPEPFLIHFTGIKPIFKSYSSNPNYKKIFFDVLAKTPWDNYTPRSDYIRLAKKAYDLLIKKIAL